MSNRSDEEVVEQIKNLIETQVKPAVANHGGVIEFVSYDKGHLLLELGGACSGCSGSSTTLKHGVENMIRYYVPEVQSIDAQDDMNSTVAPYYTDELGHAHWNTIPIKNESENESTKNS